MLAVAFLASLASETFVTQPMTAAAVSTIEGVARSGSVPPIASASTALYAAMFGLWLARMADLVRRLL